MPGIDLNSLVDFGQESRCSAGRKGLANVYGPHRVRPGDGRHPPARLRALRTAVPGPAPAPVVLLLRPPALSGLRPIDVPREPARHRDVPAGAATEVVPR